MKLLFVGDSLTKGLIGASFVELLKQDHPDWIIKNAGENGYTVRNVSYRLGKEIEKDSDYDFIVIEVGHNDIILPYFDKRGLFFRFALRYLLRNGRRPVDPKTFHRKYAQMIQSIQSKCNAKIVLTTIGCINENLSSVPNQNRIEYNESIVKIANDYHCLVADVSGEMESVLIETSQTDYLLNNFLNTVYFDKKECRTDGGAERMSRKRNLRLTIDGIHLNSAGAMLYKQTIECQINKIAASM
jgi:lysophospholipase L1-like esterase